MRKPVRRAVAGLLTLRPSRPLPRPISSSKSNPRKAGTGGAGRLVARRAPEERKRDRRHKPVLCERGNSPSVMAFTEACGSMVSGTRWPSEDRGLDLSSGSSCTRRELARTPHAVAIRTRRWTSPALNPAVCCGTFPSHLFTHDSLGTLKLHLRYIVCNNIADGHTDQLPVPRLSTCTMEAWPAPRGHNLRLTSAGGATSAPMPVYCEDARCPDNRFQEPMLREALLFGREDFRPPASGSIERRGLFAKRLFGVRCGGQRASPRQDGVGRIGGFPAVSPGQSLMPTRCGRAESTKCI